MVPRLKPLVSRNKMTQRVVTLGTAVSLNTSTTILSHDSSNSPVPFEAESQINRLYRDFHIYLQQGQTTAEAVEKVKRVYIRKKSYFPVYRVIKSDLRRKYGVMLNNSVNSGDLQLLRSFLTEYTTPDFQYVATVDAQCAQAGGMPMLPSMYKFGSQEQYLLYIAGIRNSLPDFVATIGNMQLRTQNLSEKCQLEYDMTFHGTIVPQKFAQQRQRQQQQQQACNNVSALSSPSSVDSSDASTSQASAASSSVCPSTASLDKVEVFSGGSFVSVATQQPIEPTPLTPVTAGSEDDVAALAVQEKAAQAAVDQRAAMMKANKPILFSVQARSTLRINEDRYITGLDVTVMSTQYRLCK